MISRAVDGAGGGGSDLAAPMTLAEAGEGLYSALAHMLDLYGDDFPTPEHAVACDCARRVLEEWSLVGVGGAL